MDTNGLHRDADTVLFATKLLAPKDFSEEKLIKENKKVLKSKICLRVEQIPGFGSPRRLNFIQWRPILLEFQFGTPFRPYGD